MIKKDRPRSEPVYLKVYLLFVSVVLRNIEVLVGLDNLDRDREYIVVRLEVGIMAGLAIDIDI